MSDLKGDGSNLQPPVFSSFGGGSDNTIGKNGMISLVDIFDEFLFSPEKPMNHPAPTSRVPGSNDQAKGVRKEGKDKELTFESNDFRDDDDCDDDSFDGDDADGDGFMDYSTEDGKKRKRSRGLQRNMTETQKVERRFLLLLF